MNDFAATFFKDEDADGAHAALEVLAEPRLEVSRVDFNVWILWIDQKQNLVRYAHDFLPEEGEVALDEFAEGLRARLGNPA